MSKEGFFFLQHELQDAVISYNKQIEALEKELAEQTRYEQMKWRLDYPGLLK